VRWLVNFFTRYDIVSVQGSGFKVHLMSPDRFPAWVRYSGVGLELAGAMAGLAFIGYWIDRRFGTSPWGILGGVILGLVGGLYNMVKESLEAVREAGAEDKLARDEASDPNERKGNGE
jgi:hypothetical protein